LLIYAVIYVECTINHSCCKQWLRVVYFALRVRLINAARGRLRRAVR